MSVNNIKREGLLLSLGTDSDLSLNELEKKVYYPVTNSLFSYNDAVYKYYKDLAGLTESTSYNDAIVAGMKAKLDEVPTAYIGDSYNDIVLKFWTGVRDGDIVLEGNDPREYLEFNSLNSYVQIPAVTFTGDFTISLKFVYSGAELGENLLGGNSGTTGLNVTGTGGLRYVDNASDTVISSGGECVIGVNTLVLSKTSGTVSIELNSSTIASGASTGSFTVAFIARNNPGNYFGNVIYDVDIDSSSFYAIDDGWSNNPTIVDSVGSQNGTAVNVQESDWIMVI